MLSKSARLLLAVGGLLLAGLPARPSHAWSLRGHAFITESALRLLADDATTSPALLEVFAPRGVKSREELRALMEEGARATWTEETEQESLAYWSVHPDLAKGPALEALPNPWTDDERLMHYLDIEFYAPEGPIYREDFSNLPRLADIPIEPDEKAAEAGYLPWRTRQVFAELVEALRRGDDQAARQWAGYLAHYVADAHQPHHGTIDFQSLSYFADIEDNRRLGLHGLVEGSLFREEGERFDELRRIFAGRFLDHLGAPVGARLVEEWAEDDTFRGVLIVLSGGYLFLPTIGRAGVAALDREQMRVDPALFLTTEISTGAGEARISILEIKAARMAQASQAIAYLLHRAWDIAHGMPGELVRQ